MRSHIRGVMDFLQGIGAHPRLDPHHKHPRVYYKAPGQRAERFYVLGFSPRNPHRCQLAAIADLRRLINQEKMH
jgi:hypothetical protein